MKPFDQYRSEQPLTLIDLFDPFSDSDLFVIPTLKWINKPDPLMNLPEMPRFPQAYRITINVPDFSPEKFQTEIKESNQLVLTNRESLVKELNKDYLLPIQLDTGKLVTFTDENRFFIEMPFKLNTEFDSALYPSILTNKDGSKSVEVKFLVPNNLDPTKVCVFSSGCDLILRVEDSVNKPDEISRFHFYQVF